MRFLVDTDAFCKLAAGSVFEQLLQALNLDVAECGRLAALPHMLRRGRLAQRLGPDVCEAILPLAESIPVAPAAGDDWLDQVAQIDAVDSGEAQLLALAAERGLLLFTGDKRSLGAIRGVPRLVEALAGRVMIPEAALIRLCHGLGEGIVRDRMGPVADLDTMFRACFSPTGDSPLRSLRSYLEFEEKRLQPIELWLP